MRTAFVFILLIFGCFWCQNSILWRMSYRSH